MKELKLDVDAASVRATFDGCAIQLNRHGTVLRVLRGNYKPHTRIDTCCVTCLNRNRPLDDKICVRCSAGTTRFNCRFE